MNLIFFKSGKVGNLNFFSKIRKIFSSKNAQINYLFQPNKNAIQFKDIIVISKYCQNSIFYLRITQSYQVFFFRNK